MAFSMSWQRLLRWGGGLLVLLMVVGLFQFVWPWLTGQASSGVASHTIEASVIPTQDSFETIDIYAGEGTEIDASDFLPPREYNHEEFLSEVEGVLQDQKDIRAAASSEGRSRFVDSSPGAEAERMRIRRLFQDQPRNFSSANYAESAQDQAELQRIRRLFQDQPRDAVSISSEPLSQEELQERERIRRLFFDQEGRGRSDTDLSSEELAERERIQALFQDQPRSPTLGPPDRLSGCRRGFLSLFDEDQLLCGQQGWTFPVLWGGHCPVTTCILKAGSNDDLSGRSFSTVEN